MKFVVNPEFAYLNDFIRRLPEQFLDSGEIIYSGRNLLKRYDIQRESVVVKSFKTPHLINRFVYGTLRKSKARRSYEYSLMLQQKGVNTPSPIGYIEEYRWGLRHSFYICLDTRQKRMLREFWDIPEIGDRMFILEEFGRFTARMHDAGVLHQDYSAGNIMFSVENGRVSFSLVDVNRIRFGTVGEEEGYKNLERLWLPDDTYAVIARSYARERGFDEAFAVKRVLYHKNLLMNRYK